MSSPQNRSFIENYLIQIIDVSLHWHKGQDKNTKNWGNFQYWALKSLTSDANGVQPMETKGNLSSIFEGTSLNWPDELHGGKTDKTPQEKNITVLEKA